MRELIPIPERAYAVLSWRSGVGKEKTELLSRLASKWCEVEVLTVADGVRDATVLHVRPETAHEQLSKVAELGLYYVPIRKVGVWEGFANRYVEPEPGKPWMIYGCVCRELRKCRELKEAHEKGDHRKIGELLGYPDCCIEFFDRVFVRGGVPDPVFEIAVNTDGAQVEDSDEAVVVSVGRYYPENNVLVRYFGWRAVPHLPCSFSCRESRRFAWKFLKYFSSEEREALLTLLGSGMEWDNLYGIAEVRTPLFVGIANSAPYARRHVIRLSKLI